MKINIEKSQIWTPFAPHFLYYWSDLTEIFTQYVKSKKKHFLFMMKKKTVLESLKDFLQNVQNIFSIFFFVFY